MGPPPPRHRTDTIPTPPPTPDLPISDSSPYWEDRLPLNDEEKRYIKCLRAEREGNLSLEDRRFLEERRNVGWITDTTVDDSTSDEDQDETHDNQPNQTQYSQREQDIQPQVRLYTLI